MSEDLEYLKHIFNFYDDLVDEVFDFENKEFLNRVKSVRSLTFNEMNFLLFKNQENKIMKFDSEAICCANILKYSVINYYCTYKQLLDVSICTSSLFNRLKKEKTARICCFGGGAGTELFAICNTIAGLFLKRDSNDENQYGIKLHFTVIDVCNEWERWIFSLVKKLRKIRGRNVIDVRGRFIQADVTNKWGEDVLKAVQKADILTMVKFLSALELNEVCYEKKRDLRLLQKVASEMKWGSWIFFLDFAGGGFYKKMQDIMEENPSFRLRRSFLHQNYSFTEEELKFSRPFLSLMSRNSSTKVSSGIWQKGFTTNVIQTKLTPTNQILPSELNIFEELKEELKGGLLLLLKIVVVVALIKIILF